MALLGKHMKLSQSLRLFVFGLSVAFVGCSLPESAPSGDSGTDLFSPATAGRQLCTEGVVRAQSDAGDQALCLIPEISCNASTDIKSITHCHFPPSPSPTMACCDERPPQCLNTDCDCLLRHGQWIDFALAQDAGTSLPEYNGPKRKCSYRVSCSPAIDGGLAVLACTPA